MSASLLTGMGGAAGGMLGQVGDALSAPRRLLWRLAGLPEDGTALLADTFGMDKDSGWTKALGMGAEMALDPLTYAGFGLGRLGGGVLDGIAGAEGALAGEVSSAAGARRAAMEGLTARAGLEA